MNTKELFHNKVLLFNIVVITGILIFLLIANIQQETDIEEYATIPFDHDPSLLEGELNTNVELVYDKDTFKVDYRIFKNTHNTVTTLPITEIREDRPLPMSPATSIFYIIDPLTTNNNEIRWMVAVAVKKITDEPAVYMLKVNDKIIAYFSDPFPTGYNSIIIYTLMNSVEKIEISKVRMIS